MIDLTMEIRRRVTSELKPSVKLANPEMFFELAAYYAKTPDVVCKALIKELFSLAGDNWPDRLDAAKPTETQAKPQTKIYRGQVSLVDAPILQQWGKSLNEGLLVAQRQEGDTHKPQRYYRGQPVD
jgi:hypothetical protein